jgi:hypothetical protein
MVRVGLGRWRLWGEFGRGQGSGSNPPLPQGWQRMRRRRQAMSHERSQSAGARCRRTRSRWADRGSGWARPHGSPGRRATYRSGRRRRWRVASGQLCRRLVECDAATGWVGTMGDRLTRRLRGDAPAGRCEACWIARKTAATIAFEGWEVEVDHAAFWMEHHVDGRGEKGELAAHGCAQTPLDAIAIDCLSECLADGEANARELRGGSSRWESRGPEGLRSRKK